MDIDTIKKAALLHDIGKFSYRAGGKQLPKFEKLDKDDFGWSGAHSKWSATFVEEIFGKDIADLVLYHHKPNNSKTDIEIAKIIKKADEHSSKERTELEDENKAQDIFLEPLSSVFSNVNFHDDSKLNPDEYYYSLEELNLDIKPQPVKKTAIKGGYNLKPDYEYLWGKFKNEFKSLSNPNDFNTLLSLLKKYTSLMPSAAYVSKADISLYDHSKTTSALATCRYLFSKSEKLKQTDDQETYMVISGDISGIQSFIYKLSSSAEARKGMSKRLRGRSLYLTLLNDAIANTIVNELGLSVANILFVGGGNFLIIAPNTKDTTDIVEKIKLDVNKMFIKNFNAELYLSLVLEPCSGDDLSEFGFLKEKLGYRNLLDKKQKFIDNLDDVFEVKDKFDYIRCPACGNESYKEDEICSTCKKHEELGHDAANSKYMVKLFNSSDKNKKSKVSFRINETAVDYLFFTNFKKISNVIKDLSLENDLVEVYKLNDTDFLEIAKLENLENVSYGFTFLGNTVPKLRDYTLTFSDMAQLSKGANKLGILKMDVDNLGKIFAKGLSNPSISRVSSMSFFLDMFFSGTINEITKRFLILNSNCDKCSDYLQKVTLDTDDGKKDLFKVKNYENLCESCKSKSSSRLYINYSGGDDLLLLGPYDDIILFSKEFREEFKNWTCHNGYINISAGLHLAGSKFPIARAADFAEMFLDKSKSCGRDKISLLGDTLIWDTDGQFKGFNDLMDDSKYLENLVEKGKISSGMIYSLLNMWNKHFGSSFYDIKSKESFKRDNDYRISKKSYIPLFKYKLRIIKDKTIRDELDKKIIKIMPWVKIPISWVSLRNR